MSLCYVEFAGISQPGEISPPILVSEVIWYSLVAEETLNHDPLGQDVRDIVEITCSHMAIPPQV